MRSKGGDRQCRQILQGVEADPSGSLALKDVGDVRCLVHEGRIFVLKIRLKSLPYLNAAGVDLGDRQWLTIQKRCLRQRD